MGIGQRRLCPRCNSVVAIQDVICRRCGLELRGGVERPRVDRFEVVFYLVHASAGVFATLMYVFARGSDLEFLGLAIFGVVLVSFRVHYGRRPQYPVIKARRRTRRLMRKQVVVLAPVENPLSARTIRIPGTVAWVAQHHLDEIIVRTDSPVKTTGNDRSNLLALAPIEPGDMFTTLLDLGRMRVGIWFLDPAFLSVRRINVRARRRLRPSLSIGEGTVLMTTGRSIG